MTSTTGDLSWTKQTDTVVIGGGGAGMAAAISAKEANPDGEVLLLQKIGELGGSTTMAMGSFSAAESPYQAERGISDSADAHFRDMEKFVTETASRSSSGAFDIIDLEDDFQSRDNLALRRVFVENAGETIAWLRDHGCEYAGPYIDAHHSIPRTHQILPDTGAYADVLGDVLDELTVDMMFNTEAYELVHDGGTITGVLAKSKDRTTPHIIRARNAVILATGDYINSTEYSVADGPLSEVDAINEHNTGDGHRMAREVGAELCNMDIQWTLLRLGDPLYARPRISDLLQNGSILVNANGERYVKENAGYGQILTATAVQPEKEAYILFDSVIADKYTEWPNHISTLGKQGKVFGYLEQYLETDYLHEAATVDNLAARGGMDASTLRATINAYNEGVYDEHIEQHVDPLGRTEHRTQLSDRPFYLLGPLRPYRTLTDGGVAINTSMNVLTSDGQPIDGLFAAGSIAGDHHLLGHGHHLAWVFTSGRIAGREAASRLPAA